MVGHLCVWKCNSNSKGELFWGKDNKTKNKKKNKKRHNNVAQWSPTRIQKKNVSQIIASMLQQYYFKKPNQIKLNQIKSNYTKYVTAVLTVSEDK